MQSLCLFLLFSFRHIQAQCGPDCSSCNNDIAGCDSDTNCFYLVDNDICTIKNTCSSDCRLCLTQTECTNIGAGGVGNLCAWNPSTDTCFGITCDTDCSNCSPVQQDPANPGQTFCEASRAPPRGCIAEGTEECIYKTPEPTTTTLEPTTSAMPTATPTTASPTVSTTDVITTDQVTTSTMDDSPDDEDEDDENDDGDDSNEDDTESDEGDDDDISVDTESDEEDDEEGDSDDDSTSDDDDDDECDGLSKSECTYERDSDGDNICGYNVETDECYSIVRRAGMNGIGSFDDGFVSAQSVAKAEADKLFTVVGVLAAIGGTLLIVAVIGGYYMWRESVIRRRAEYTQTVMNYNGAC